MEWEYEDFTNEFSWPKDCKKIWRVNDSYYSKYIVEYENHIDWHVTTGGVFTEEGDFKTAIKKMFPNLPISIERKEIRLIKEQIV